MESKYCFLRCFRLVHFFESLFVMCGKRPNTKAQYYGLPSHMVKLEGSKSLLVNPPLCQTPCLSRRGCSSYLSRRSGVQFFTGLQHHSNKSIPSSCGNQGFLHGFVHFTFPNLNSIGWGFFLWGVFSKVQILLPVLCLFGSSWERDGEPSFSHRTLPFSPFAPLPSLPNHERVLLSSFIHL